MTREIPRLEEERDVLADVVPSFGVAFFLPRLVERFGGDDVTRALSRPTSLTAWAVSLVASSYGLGLCG